MVFKPKHNIFPASLRFWYYPLPRHILFTLFIWNVWLQWIMFYSLMAIVLSTYEIWSSYVCCIFCNYTSFRHKKMCLILNYIIMKPHSSLYQKRKKSKWKGCQKNDWGKVKVLFLYFEMPFLFKRVSQEQTNKGLINTVQFTLTASYNLIQLTDGMLPPTIWYSHQFSAFYLMGACHSWEYSGADTPKPPQATILASPWFPHLCLFCLCPLVTHSQALIPYPWLHAW